MSIKKYSSGQWVDIPYRKYGTEQDTLTSLPADVIADGQSASANIIGNMVQTGTPSPSSIIMPSETGDKTANLFDGYIEVGGLDTNTGAETGQTDRRRSDFIEIEANTNYNLSRTMTATTSNLWALFYDENEDYISGSNKGTSNADFSVLSPANAKYLRWYVTANGSYDNLMIVEGSTAPSEYIPYGYKIPILSGGTTTPVYLGEVQSTRKIKKLVLTGQENVTSLHTDIGLYIIPITDYLKNVGVVTNICSHYKAGINVSGWSEVTDKTSRFYGNPTSTSKLLYIRDSSYTSIIDFKTYLAQQYSAGTPVTVWYVLATPTTGIVNEPLRKIGDYSDSVSVTGIPTTGTAESFDVDTSLKPSEVSLTYHGWHEHSDTKFTG